jgi:hypothetical protein
MHIKKKNTSWQFMCSYLENSTSEFDLSQQVQIMTEILIMMVVMGMMKLNFRGVNPTDTSKLSKPKYS